jgi:glycosyltransferase involved in cell wall biosynthesis
MKFAWLISNWKRTGPVEPSLDLAAAVAAAGHEVEVFVGRAPAGGEAGARDAALARGLTVATAGPALGKHRHPVWDRLDRRRLTSQLRSSPPHVLVATLSNAHRLAAAVAPRLAPQPRVARLYFRAPDHVPSGSERRALHAAACVFAPTPSVRDHLVAAGVADARAILLPPALGVRALREQGAGDRQSAREALGIPDSTFCFGIIARMQRHRRFELLWDAAAQLRDSEASFRIFVVGRGTYAEQVAYVPVRERGLEDVVSFRGYLRGPRYVRTLAACDAQILLVPGSDPTCRALREGMALGVPSIATRLGMLPEIVVDGETGWLVDESVEGLAAAMSQALRDREETHRRGRAAQARAASLYEPGDVADWFLAALAGAQRDK